MRRFLFLLMISILGMTQVMAQDYDYVPFVREGVQWVCYYNKVIGSGFGNLYVDEEPFHAGRNYFTLEMKGDVEINGKVYKALHKYSGDAINTENDTVLVYLREEDNVVYGIVPVGERYRDFLIGYGWLYYTEYPYSEISAGNEFLLYDFNDTDSFCQWIYRRDPERIKDSSCDLISIGKKYTMRHTYSIYDDGRYDMYLIEGIGADGYRPCYPLFFLNVGFVGPYYYLSHVIEDGEIIYKGVNYEYLARWDGRLPIAREGMKWVNERVIVNKGDTTRYYYTYELKDFDTTYEHKVDNEFFYCHYYTGDGIDPENDSIICSIGEYPSMNITMVLNNPAMDNVVEEGRNMLERRYISEAEDLEELYFISHDNPRRIFNEYYSWQIRQRPYKITDENFFEVEPVEIEGHECRRYAYVGEDGEPIAYIIEGIGFDSYDMGDLLTPFTRKPEPDEDYQEYWGLSHVIKDGQIIYKGMRYNPNVPGDLPGDVNGDGEVNLADANSLIDIVVMGGNAGHTRTSAADVNEDGEISIADVNIVIEFILENSQQINR